MATIAMRRIREGEVPFDGGTAIQEDPDRPVFRGNGTDDYVCVELRERPRGRHAAGADDQEGPRPLRPLRDGQRRGDGLPVPVGVSPNGGGACSPVGGCRSRSRAALCHAPPIVDLADTTLRGVLERISSSDPVPGAGPAAALASGFAAALVEMVCAVTLGQQPANVEAIEARRRRAAELRALAPTLAESDMDAYSQVLAERARREEPGHAQRLRAALAAAADPPVAIVEAAAELTGLAAGAFADARGGVRGEAAAAALLAEAVVRIGAAIVDLNLAGSTGDPRRARVRELAQAALAERERVLA